MQSEFRPVSTRPLKERFTQDDTRHLNKWITHKFNKKYDLIVFPGLPISHLDLPVHYAIIHPSFVETQIKPTNLDPDEFLDTLSGFFHRSGAFPDTALYIQSSNEHDFLPKLGITGDQRDTWLIVAIHDHWSAFGSQAFRDSISQSIINTLAGGQP